MILYHGTDQIFNVIDLTKSRMRTDFGKGFYLSDKLGNARAWAIDKSTDVNIPTVMRIDIDESLLSDASVKFLKFDNPSVVWLEFVKDNRRRKSPGGSKQEPRHSYDVVSGPIANDKVAIAVDKYCRGVLTAEETLEEVRTISGVFQISMHTQLALSYIRSMTFSQRVNKQWASFV